jgi:hypothetical protein
VATCAIRSPLICVFPRNSCAIIIRTLPGLVLTATRDTNLGRIPLNGMVLRRSLEVVECGARRRLMKLHVLGIDLGKAVFHLVGLAQGKHLLTQLAETPRARCRDV